MNELEKERENSRHLAETLQLAMKLADPEFLHVIVVPGTQITMGDIAKGALAIHDAMQLQEEGLKPWSR